MSFPWDGLPCPIFIHALGKSFPYSVSDCLPVPHTNPTELCKHFISSENVKWKGVLSAIPCSIAEMRDEHLHSPPSPEVKALLPYKHVVSGKQRSGAGGQPGCPDLGSDKHDRSSGLTTTHTHPCSCPSPGFWSSLAKGMQGFFSTYALTNAVLSGKEIVNSELEFFFLLKDVMAFFCYVWLLNLK